MYLCFSRQAMRQPTHKETAFRRWNAAGIVVFASPLSFGFRERTSAHPWIPAAMDRSGFSLFRWRDGTKLVEHTQPIEQPAELRDLAGSDAVEHEPGHCHLS